MVDEFEYEDKGEVGEPVVETFGSPGKCAFCDRPADYEVHVWPDAFHCSTIFCCKSCFDKRYKGKAGGGGRYVGSALFKMRAYPRLL